MWETLRDCDVNKGCWERERIISLFFKGLWMAGTLMDVYMQGGLGQFFSTLILSSTYFQWPPRFPPVHRYVLQATWIHCSQTWSLCNTKITLYSFCPLSSQLQSLKRILLDISPHCPLLSALQPVARISTTFSKSCCLAFPSDLFCLWLSPPIFLCRIRVFWVCVSLTQNPFLREWGMASYDFQEKVCIPLGLQKRPFTISLQRIFFPVSSIVFLDANLEPQSFWIFLFVTLCGLSLSGIMNYSCLKSSNSIPKLSLVDLETLYFC